MWPSDTDGSDAETHAALAPLGVEIMIKIKEGKRKGKGKEKKDKKRVEIAGGCGLYASSHLGHTGQLQPVQWEQQGISQPNNTML